LTVSSQSLAQPIVSITSHMPDMPTQHPHNAWRVPFMIEMTSVDLLDVVVSRSCLAAENVGFPKISLKPTKFSAELTKISAGTVDSATLCPVIQLGGQAAVPSKCEPLIHINPNYDNACILTSFEVPLTAATPSPALRLGGPQAALHPYGFPHPVNSAFTHLCLYRSPTVVIAAATPSPTLRLGGPPVALPPFRSKAPAIPCVTDMCSAMFTPVAVVPVTPGLVTQLGGQPDFLHKYDAMGPDHAPLTVLPLAKSVVIVAATPSPVQQLGGQSALVSDSASRNSVSLPLTHPCLEYCPRLQTSAGSPCPAHQLGGPPIAPLQSDSSVQAKSHSSHLCFDICAQVQFSAATPCPVTELGGRPTSLPVVPSLVSVKMLPSDPCPDVPTVVQAAAAPVQAMSFSSRRLGGQELPTPALLQPPWVQRFCSRTCSIHWITLLLTLLAFYLAVPVLAMQGPVVNASFCPPREFPAAPWAASYLPWLGIPCPFVSNHPLLHCAHNRQILYSHSASPLSLCPAAMGTTQPSPGATATSAGVLPCFTSLATVQLADPALAQSSAATNFRINFPSLSHSLLPTAGHAPVLSPPLPAAAHNYAKPVLLAQAPRSPFSSAASFSPASSSFSQLLTVEPVLPLHSVSTTLSGLHSFCSATCGPSQLLPAVPVLPLNSVSAISLSSSTPSPVFCSFSPLSSAVHMVSLTSVPAALFISGSSLPPSPQLLSADLLLHLYLVFTYLPSSCSFPAASAICLQLSSAVSVQAPRTFYVTAHGSDHTISIYLSQTDLSAAITFSATSFSFLQLSSAVSLPALFPPFVAANCVMSPFFALRTHTTFSVPSVAADRRTHLLPVFSVARNVSFTELSLLPHFPASSHMQPDPCAVFSPNSVFQVRSLVARPCSAQPTTSSQLLQERGTPSPAHSALVSRTKHLVTNPAPDGYTLETAATQPHPRSRCPSRPTPCSHSWN